mmetsp:Transcript_42127/g.131095  ORF Transcript_42127/g.131095 Transcript_42127/m.131095 type:complete len:280 (+) Transcript_42127:318-1157(+)
MPSCRRLRLRARRRYRARGLCARLLPTAAEATEACRVLGLAVDDRGEAAAAPAGTGVPGGGQVHGAERGVLGDNRGPSKGEDRVHKVGGVPGLHGRHGASAAPRGEVLAVERLAVVAALAGSPQRSMHSLAGRQPLPVGPQEEPPLAAEGEQRGAGDLASSSHEAPAVASVKVHHVALRIAFPIAGDAHKHAMVLWQADEVQGRLRHDVHHGAPPVVQELLAPELVLAGDGLVLGDVDMVPGRGADGLDVAVQDSAVILVLQHLLHAEEGVAAVVAPVP